jgi:hypothetical protein
MASVAADIVQAFNQLAARQIDVGASPTVLTVATINMGVRNNIIPEDLTMTGTLRTFNAERRADVIDKVQKTVAAIGDRYGAKAQAVFTQPYPVTRNDPALSAWVKPVLEQASPGKVDDQAALVTGAEDFSRYGEKIPAVFIQLGGRPADVPAATAPANHSPYFDVDEAVFETGVKAEVLLALDYLAGSSARRASKETLLEIRVPGRRRGPGLSSPAAAQTALTPNIGGRVVAQPDGAYVFGWPGVYFEGRFTGRSIEVPIDPGREALAVSIDGQRQERGGHAGRGASGL